MMYTRCINVRNVNEALPQGLLWLQNRGLKNESRNGPVAVSPQPVITAYSNPTERVLFSPVRDANPFFHLMEGLWMLAGRNDVAWITEFNSKFGTYSDNGETFHGAYGFRWRHWFGVDQIKMVIEELKRDPLSRRAVIAMWDPEEDPVRAAEGGKDVPCNTSIYFSIMSGKLVMYVSNRSNDVIWGAYGANAVHMSMLQEYVAACLGVEVGTYYQASFNFHCYTDVYPMDGWDALGRDCTAHDYYARDLAAPYPLMQAKDPVVWDNDLRMFIEGFETDFLDPFFFDVAVPMRQAWRLRKQSYADALAAMEAVKAADWKLAGKAWLQRRADRKQREEIRA